jgi:GTPase SAR1 family protein
MTKTFKLPTKKTPPVKNIEDLSILIYGPTKVGKTTICSEFPSPLFLAFEPGTKALDTYEVDISSWADFLEYCKLIKAGDHPFKTIVLDTADIAYKLCTAHMGKKHGFEHPSDLGYGKGSSFVNNEFLRVITSLARLPYGVILTSHAKTVDVKTRTGDITKTISTLPNSGREILNGFVDLILFFESQDTRDTETGKIVNKRIIHTKPTPSFDAGDRLGLLPPVVPMNFDALNNALKRGIAAKSAGGDDKKGNSQ